MIEAAQKTPKLEDNITIVADVLDTIPDDSPLSDIAEHEVPEPIKKPVTQEELAHTDFKTSAFWQSIPAFRDVSEDEFLDYRFQNKQSITNKKGLEDFLTGVVDAAFIEDVKQGLAKAPMNMRISPYMLSLIDWSNPYDDPIRTQFMPVGSTQLPDHPQLKLDSLHEQQDSPVSGLVHRYHDKALFLPLDVCPVYCRFCTRSYAIGNDTETVDKVNYKPNKTRWNDAFAYLASRPEIEDVVISGGDAYMLPTHHLQYIGEMLLAIPHIRRIRFATKGPAVMPMKILSDTEWVDTLTDIVEKGRKLHKEVCLHTHFNSINEITDITRRAMNNLFERGVKVRNQCVLIRGVNDNAEAMIQLTRMLSYMNVQPYYVYQHDMVSGVEELRTSVATTLEIERTVRGSTAGFNTPIFVTDAPGGGGKRDVHSFDYYDEETGISVYRSPSVDEEKVYFYFDPLHALSEDVQKRWMDEFQQRRMIQDALKQSGLEKLKIAF
jgi:lysine 2,3-aminomutase